MRTMSGAVGACALLAAALMLSHPAEAGWNVRISGSVITPMDTEDPVTIVVYNGEGDTVWQRTSNDARFSVKLPGDQIYTIGFSQPDCVLKEVVIDTRYTKRSLSRVRMRKVQFTVVLEPDPNAELQYSGPVGRIVFEEGSGRMLVEHRYTLEKRRRQ